MEGKTVMSQVLHYIFIFFSSSNANIHPTKKKKKGISERLRDKIMLTVDSFKSVITQGSHFSWFPHTTNQNILYLLLHVISLSISNS